MLYRILAGKNVNKPNTKTCCAFVAYFVTDLRIYSKSLLKDVGL